MDYKESMQFLEAFAEKAENKEEFTKVLDGIRGHNTSKNDQTKTLNDELQKIKDEFKGQSELIGTLKDSIAQIGQGVGKDIKAENLDELTIKTLTNDLSEVKKTLEENKKAAEEEAQKQIQLKKTNTITDAISGKVVDVVSDLRGDFVDTWANKFDFNSEKELVNSDGKRFDDFAKEFFSEKKQFLNNPVKSGANIDSAATGSRDSTIARVQAAMEKARTNK